MAAIISSYVKGISTENLKSVFKHDHLNNLILKSFGIEAMKKKRLYRVYARINGLTYNGFTDSRELVKAWHRGPNQSFTEGDYNNWDAVVLELLGLLPDRISRLITK